MQDVYIGAALEKETTSNDKDLLPGGIRTDPANSKMNRRHQLLFEKNVSAALL